MKDTHLTIQLGTWLSAGSPVITEQISMFPFDWLLFDLEHGCMTANNLLSNLQAVACPEIKCIVRPGSYDPAWWGRMLDWGVDGIMMPHVHSAGEVREYVKALYYPPKGVRGVSKTARAYRYGLSGSGQDLDAFRPVFLAQIETVEGLEQVEEIAAVEEVDILFVGPSDLQQALGGTNFMDYHAALMKVACAAKKRNKLCGILVRDPADLPELIRMGYTFIAMGSDQGMIRAGYEQLFSGFYENR
ncbi:MAG: aldolase/citrate lyase family protein [Tannerellaceae bacterium]|nr:aldolase/citrate lyase family protein [Tannerellaceae bacterium]